MTLCLQDGSRDGDAALVTLQRRLATRTKTKSPQTNGICERFHKTVLNEFYRIAFRKKVYRSIDELQADLDTWIAEYNEARPHQLKCISRNSIWQTAPG